MNVGEDDAADWGEEEVAGGGDDWGSGSGVMDMDDSKWEADKDKGWDEDSKDDVDADNDVPKQPMRQESYAVLDPATLEARSHRLVKQIADLFDVDPDEANCMLRHYGWKEQKLQQDWFASEEKVRKLVGLSGRKSSSSCSHAPASCSASVQCESAFCDSVPVSRAASLNCGHWFCDECWAGYLISQINSGRSCVFTRCMGMKCVKKGCTHKFGCACDEMLPESVFYRYVKDSQLLEKYRRWMLDNFVEGTKQIKWCPNPQCGNAVEYKPGGSKSVKCSCGFEFCFSCSQVAHVPAPCDLVSKWLQKEQSDDATAVWLAARTKQCPKCTVRIEKNKACNHMRCVKCGHDFCWLCKGPWSDHGSGTGGYYVCNKYNEDAAKGSVSEEEKAIVNNQKLLQKYRFYYNRFRNSIESIAMTRKFGVKMEAKLGDTDIGKSSFLVDAIHKLIEARRVLQWTYSMAYYMRAGREKNLFEYQQELLIVQTEGLQELMENTQHDQLPSKRHDIIDRTSTMDRFRREIVKKVEEGVYEAILLPEADTTTGMWGCTACKAENRPEVDMCVGCTACRTHGEQECKGCKAKQSKK